MNCHCRKKKMPGSAATEPGKHSKISKQETTPKANRIQGTLSLRWFVRGEFADAARRGRVGR
jgi:hypothetical protein